MLVRFSPEEMERTQQAAARASQATSARIRLTLAREAVLEAVNALEGDEESRKNLAWIATQNLAKGKRAEWLPDSLKAVERANTRAALDRVRAAVKALDEIEGEFFSRKG
jgi:uncharacterized membrane protein